MTAPRNSSEAQIEALQAVCEQLGGFDDRVSVEWLDGCMAALIAGPRVVPPQEWLTALLDDVWERTFADPSAAQVALQAVMARWSVLASQLDPQALFDEPDELRLMPLLGDFSAERIAGLVADGEITAQEAADFPRIGEIWAQGALEAIEAFVPDWHATEALGDEAPLFDDCVADLAALTAPDDGDEQRASSTGAQAGPVHDRDKLVDAALFAMQDLRCLWVDHAPRQPPRRVAPAPGRNEPCPCGSGKKYKKCHGAT